MRRVLVLAVVLAGLAVPAGAGAVTLVTPDGQLAQPFERWTQTSKIPLPLGTVTVLPSVPEMCGPYTPDCSSPQFPGTVWLAPKNGRNGTLHELGHVFDYKVMTDAYRAGFEKVMRDRRPWRSSPNSPHEQFAEAVSVCARYAWFGPHQEEAGFGYAYRPSLRQHRRVCALIRRAARAASQPRL